MEIGIFAKTFSRPTLEGVFNAIDEYGITCVQYNMSCAGLSALPDAIDPVIAEKIARESKAHNIRIAAVSGTFNMIHPDVVERERGLDRLRVLAAACKKIGASVITLCTGTRDPENMWRKHVNNNDDSAWNDLLRSMESAVGIAEEHDVILAVEPEVSNVVDSAEKARKLLDEIQSPKLKIVMDAANLFHTGEIVKMHEVMDKAFALLANDIIIAHAKDLVGDGTVEFVAAGQGVLDYDYYLKLLHSYKYQGALILHGLGEFQVEQSVKFLKDKIRK